MPVDPQALTQSMPFAVALGVEVTAAAPEEVRGRLGAAVELCSVSRPLWFCLDGERGSVRAFGAQIRALSGGGVPHLRRTPQ